MAEPNRTRRDSDSFWEPDSTSSQRNPIPGTTQPFPPASPWGIQPNSPFPPSPFPQFSPASSPWFTSLGQSPAVPTSPWPALSSQTPLPSNHLGHTSQVAPQVAPALEDHGSMATQEGHEGWEMEDDTDLAGSPPRRTHMPQSRSRSGSIDSASPARHVVSNVVPGWDSTVEEQVEVNSQDVDALQQEHPQVNETRFMRSESVGSSASSCGGDMVSGVHGSKAAAIHIIVYGLLMNRQNFEALISPFAQLMMDPSEAPTHVTMQNYSLSFRSLSHIRGCGVASALTREQSLNSAPPLEGVMYRLRPDALEPLQDALTVPYLVDRVELSPFTFMFVRRKQHADESMRSFPSRSYLSELVQVATEAGLSDGYCKWLSEQETFEAQLEHMLHPAHSASNPPFSSYHTDDLSLETLGVSRQVPGPFTEYDSLSQWIDWQLSLASHVPLLSQSTRFLSQFDFPDYGKIAVTLCEELGVQSHAGACLDDEEDFNPQEYDIDEARLISLRSMLSLCLQPVHVNAPAAAAAWTHMDTHRGPTLTSHHSSPSLKSMVADQTNDPPPQEIPPLTLSPSKSTNDMGTYNTKARPLISNTISDVVDALSGVRKVFLVGAVSPNSTELCKGRPIFDALIRPLIVGTPQPAKLSHALLTADPVSPSLVSMNPHLPPKRNWSTPKSTDESHSVDFDHLNGFMAGVMGHIVTLRDIEVLNQLLFLLMAITKQKLLSVRSVRLFPSDGTVMHTDAWIVHSRLDLTRTVVQAGQLSLASRSWICVNCAERNEGHFRLCPLCELPKGLTVHQVVRRCKPLQQAHPQPQTTVPTTLAVDGFETMLYHAEDAALPPLAHAHAPPSPAHPALVGLLPQQPASPYSQGDSSQFVWRPIIDENPSAHPERPDRLRAVLMHLHNTGLTQRCIQVGCRLATREELLAAHPIEHIEKVEATAPLAPIEAGDTLAWRDAYCCPGTAISAKMAAGTTMEVVKDVLEGRARNGVACVRPPGHHAEPNICMGFCLYNNVAVAAENAKMRYPGVERILILDWDVHHGNGTQEIFESDPSVLYMSLHRYPFYPNTGAPSEVGQGPGTGFNVNIGWSMSRMGDPEYLAAFDRVIMPIARAFNPQLVFISAGFDAAMGDPLGGCRVSPVGYSQMTERLISIGAPVVLVLEGGYNLQSLSRSMEACVRVILGEPALPYVQDNPLSKTAEEEIQLTAAYHLKYWPCLRSIWGHSLDQLAASLQYAPVSPAFPRSP